jgi:hypothetical protein
LEAVYVGEAEDLRRRLGNYLSPGERKTAARVRSLLQEYQAQGKEIRLQSLQFEDFAVNSYVFEFANLSNPFARRAIENLVIVDTIRFGCKVLNKGADAIEKKIGALFKKVPEVFDSFSLAQKAEFSKTLRNLAKTKQGA